MTPSERQEAFTIREDLITQLQQLRRDLSAMQARLTDTLELAARLPLESNSTEECPFCGLELSSARRLDEHLENVHASPPEPS